MMTDEWRIIYDELRIRRKKKNEERKNEEGRLQIKGLAYECLNSSESMYIKGLAD